MTASTYLEFEDQATGANNNTWGDVADANFAIFELAIARVLGVSTTGGTTTLTTAQNRYPIINVTGVLVSNATIVVRTAEKNFIIINNTTGAFTLTVKTTAGSGKTCPRGRATTVYCDGTNVEHARNTHIASGQAGGTVDAITVTCEPPITAAELQDNTLVIVEASGASTSTTPSLTVDATTTRTITKNGGQALVAGDIPRIGYKCLYCYDLSSTRWELLNPNGVSSASTTEVLTGTDASKAVTPDSLAALWEKGADKASAGTTSFDEGGYVHITGTTTITDLDFATAKDGRGVKVIFDGILTLTHNATTLKLPGNANITTAAGDRAEFVQDSGDNIICLWYTRAASAPGGGGVTVIRRQVFTADGTYTPHANMLYCTVTATGGGGGSGGCNGNNNAGGTGGAGAGGTCRETYSAATIGASQTVTVGTGGAGGATGNNTGVDGEDTTFGALMTAGGGKLSAGANGSSTAMTTVGGLGGTCSGGEINITGGDGGSGWGIESGLTIMVGGHGGASFWGGGPTGGRTVTTNSDGVAGKAYGTGGSGSASGTATSAGAAGANGVVEVIEYCSA